MKVFILFLFALFLPSISAISNKVICYYASWAVNRPSNGRFTPEDINPNLCTHINYAFIGLNNDGTLKILDEVNDVQNRGFERVASLKKQNPNLKVLFSIGGAAADPSVFGQIARSEEKRVEMGKSALKLLYEYNFDGLDVDWEYPRGGDSQAFVDLLNTLRAALKPQGFLLTVAVNSIPDEVGGYDIRAMSNILDIINVMTYDFHAMWGGSAEENAPLFGSTVESDWQKENRNANASISQWLAGGADSQKLAIGIPFYGHTFQLGNSGQHNFKAPTAGPWQPGPYTDNLGSLGYNEICEFHPNGNVVFMDDMKVPYMYDGNFWVGYDNEEAVREKVKYAKEKNLAGVMIWSIETDDMKGFCGTSNGLLKAINDEMLS